MSKKQRLEAPSRVPPSPTSPELIVPFMAGSEESVESSSASSSPEPPPYNANDSTITSTAYYSPSFSPYTAPTPSQQAVQPLDGNHPILPSPALRPLYYSPQIRPQTHSDSQQQPGMQSNTNINTDHPSNNSSTASWRVHQPIIASTTPSPALQPQHRPSLSASITSPMFNASDSIIDHEASAALLMLNMDRRGLSISESAGVSGERAEHSPTPLSTSSNERKVGMSVRDLLTS